MTSITRPVWILLLSLASCDDPTSLASATSASIGAPRLLRVDGGRGDRGLAITTDAASNVYLAGSVSGSSRSEFAVAKFNPRGRREWLARHGGSAGGPLGEARAVAVDGEGNVYAAGITRTTVGITSTVRGVLVKFNPRGREEWVRVVDGSPSFVAIDGAGSVVVSGGGFLTQKFTAAGALSWTRSFRGSRGFNDNVTGLSLDRSGNVVVTGWTDSITAVRGATDVATLKYDAAGNTLWERVFTDTAASDEKPWDVAVDAGGNVYVTGVTSEDTAGELPVFGLFLKYGPAGDLLIVDVGESSGGQAVVVDGDGLATVAGASPPHVSRFAPSGARLWTTAVQAATDLAVDAAGDTFVSGGPYLTTQLDADGAIVSEHRLGGRATVSDVVLDASGNLHVTGTSFGSALSTSSDIVTLTFATAP